MSKKREKEILSKITIRLDFGDKKINKTICNATSPENQEVPKNTEAKSEIKNEKIEFITTSKGKFWNLITTTEDFFEKIAISLKTIDEIKKK